MWAGPIQAAQPSNPISEVITISGSDSWNSSIEVTGAGQIVVEGNLTITGDSVRLRNITNDGTPVFQVKENGTLSIENGTDIDLSGIGNRPFLSVENGNAVFAGGKIHGADGTQSRSIIDIIGSTAKVEIRGAKIFDNTIREIKTEGGIIYIENGNLSVYSTDFYSNRILKDLSNDKAGIILIRGGNNSELFFDTVSFYENRNHRTMYDIRAFKMKLIHMDNCTYRGTTQDGFLRASDSKVEIGKNNQFYGGTEKSSLLIYGDYSQIYVDENNLFTGDKYRAIYLYSGMLEVNTNNIFTENAYPIFGEFCYINIKDKNKFTHNSRSLFAHGSTYDSLRIGNENEFSDNSSDEGGAVYVGGQKLIIGNSNVFRNNTASETGGAVYSAWANLTIGNGNIFIGNQASEKGGAVAHDYEFDGVRKPFSIGDDNIFSENKSPLGGAVYIADCPGTIGASTFANNTAESGGAVYIGSGADVRMKGLALTSNTSAAYGGGIAVRSGGSLRFQYRNGAGIFGNEAASMPANTQDLYFEDGTDLPEEKMFNGGLHQWQHDGAMKMFGSSPTNRDLSGAGTKIQSNTARSDQPETTAFGGGIAVLGTLTIGEDSASLEVTKLWDDAHDEAGIRPSAGNYPGTLVLKNWDEIMPFGNLIPDGKETDSDGSELYRFHFSGDPFISMSLKDGRNDRYQIRYDDLPASLNDYPDLYSIEEEDIPGYEMTGITGDMEHGFVITNKALPQPTPTATNTPVPTLVPSETPTPEITPSPTVIPTVINTPTSALNFFNLADELETLPQTGF